MQISRRTILAGTAVATLLLAGGGALQAYGRSTRVVELPPEPDTSFGDQKVVYHLVEDGGFMNRRAKRWLTNMENHRASMGVDSLDQVVVMNGDGLDLLTAAQSDPAIAARIDALKKAGTKFLICRKSLASRRLDWRRDLYGVRPEDVVVSAMPTLAALERQGYSYVRP